MTATPRPTPADLQTWRREAQDYLDGGRHTGTAPRMAPRILALLDALTAKDEALAEQNAELAGVKEVCDSWQQCGETLMKFLPSGEPVTRGTLPDVLWKRIPEIIREARVELGVYREADRRSHAESARLTAQVAELQRQLAETCREWQDISTAPQMRKVMVSYVNALGKRRVVLACYYLANALEMDDDYADVGIYDEATGNSYAPEGWYEEHDSDNPIMSLQADPTHWMPLPPAPPAAGEET